MSDLDPSVLGTRSHWDAAYTREITNFASNPDDEGIIWFAESNAEDTLLRYLSTAAELPPSPSFLDIGTGNGHLLFALRENEDYEPFTGTMVGIDYSPASITLARTIAGERGMQDIIFEEADVIKDELSAAPWVPKEEGGFDVVLDKGTYDAISLSEETLEDGRRVYEDYPRKVAEVVKKGGLLVITSCNWTVEELREKFKVDGLEWVQEIKYPSFRFGGKTGQTISSAVWRRI